MYTLLHTPEGVQHAIREYLWYAKSSAGPTAALLEVRRPAPVQMVALTESNLHRPGGE